MKRYLLKILKENILRKNTIVGVGLIIVAVKFPQHLQQVMEITGAYLMTDKS